MSAIKISLASIILSLILFLFGMELVDLEVSAGADPGQSAFSQKREGFLIYNNTDFGFQLLYPQDWTFIEGDSKPGDYQTDIVIFEPLGEKGKHFTKKFYCGEVCLAITIYSSLAGDTTLRQFSDDAHNKQKALGRS
jgi:hypothetical protein